METHEFTRSFEMDGLILSPTHVRIEQLSPIIAAHRHSNSSYEIHYTAHGRGRVLIGEAAYTVEPGTVYVTGPNVLHAQFSDALDPVVEYCLYLNCRSARRLPGLQRRAGRKTARWSGNRSNRGFCPYLRREGYSRSA